MVAAINDAIVQGLHQKDACEIFGIDPRKLRRWSKPRPARSRTPWNKILPQEREAIEAAVYHPDLIGKPLSHVFVHGHQSGAFHTSLSTVYRVLKAKDLVKPLQHRRRTTTYVSAHTLLNEGFSLLCYDGTLFRTSSGVIVWALPVIILPHRYLLHVGYSLHSVSSTDLTRAVQEAHALVPEHIGEKLLAHSDRGSAMKSRFTQKTIKELVGAPVHFGRPHTPDDQAWIEAFIKTFKYHREAPASFDLVDDILCWFERFPAIYNNDPHSALDYVTPLQALSGQKEVILTQRKENLAGARLLRYSSWVANRHNDHPVCAEVIPQPV